MNCCDEHIEAEVMTGWDERDGRYFQRRYSCPHCLNVEYEPREYVKRTATRGNKLPYIKEIGHKRGPDTEGDE